VRKRSVKVRRPRVKRASRPWIRARSRRIPAERSAEAVALL